MKKHGHNPSHIFKGKKGDIWEGGHREPTIIFYPEMIQGGTATSQMSSLSDIYSTIAELIHAEVADSSAEDSISNVPLWQGEDAAVREDIVHTPANGGFSIRRGDWKLELVMNGGGLESAFEEADDDLFKPAELYNLKEDISETNNVIDEQPALVESLKASLEEYVVKGRSTPGVPQENNRNNPKGAWPQLRWMDGYKAYIERFKYD